MFLFFSVPEIWKTGLTCFIGLATLIGIMTRPFRWNEAVIAMVGAAVLLLLGLITPRRRFLNVSAGLEYVSLFSRDDGLIGPGRGGRLV
jgi:arsenical pump membrane protein